MDTISKTARTMLLLLSFIAMNQLSISAQTKDDWANFSRYAEANKTIPERQIVFMGNSITQGWPKADPDFFRDNNYVGRGIGGQTTSQMLVRFRRDVIDLKPKAVVILAGVNDIARNTGFISLENIFGNILSMIELAQAHKIKVVLCSVLPASGFRWRPELEPAEDIIKLNQMISAYAQSNGIPYVDYHTVLKDEKNGLPEKYAKDGVHPTPEGYKVMEKLLQEVLLKMD